MRRAVTVLAIGATVIVGVAGSVPALPAVAEPATSHVATGFGGAIATVDATATAVGLDVLRSGGNAVDAAVAAAATLGVTEPFSSGIGGGGFLLCYDARTGSVNTIDGRESAPASVQQNAFIDADTGLPYAFPEARVSGISVGVPGTLLTWHEALRRWGTRPLSAALDRAAQVAEDGFVVDQTFNTQVGDNAAAFAQFESTRKLYLPGGQPPVIGSILRNPDLADTYRSIARNGPATFYQGAVAHDIVAAVQSPPVAADPAALWPYPIRGGGLAPADLAAYQVRFPSPTRSDYRGFQVYGMPPPSSGGTAVGAALNVLERFELRGQSIDDALHHYLEASALAFADRNRYVGDNTPPALLRELISDRYAKERACLIDPAHALLKPVAPGVPDGPPGHCAAAEPGGDSPAGQSTTNLTVADRWGNVVEYTLTIEQTGGNAMVVPGRGFLLNNKLTDFNFAPTKAMQPIRTCRRQASAHAANVPDHRALGRQAIPSARQPRRRDDHHDRPANLGQPDRPGHDPARRACGATRFTAQHVLDPGRAGVHHGSCGGESAGPRSHLRCNRRDRRRHGHRVRPPRCAVGGRRAGPARWWCCRRGRPGTGRLVPTRQRRRAVEGRRLVTRSRWGPPRSASSRRRCRPHHDGRRPTRDELIGDRTVENERLREALHAARPVTSSKRRPTDWTHRSPTAGGLLRRPATAAAADLGGGR